MTQPVAIDYSETAAEVLLDCAAEDARCDPEFFEPSVRALLGGWLATVDADSGHGDWAVRDPTLWLVFVTGPEYGVEPPGLAVTVYVAGRRWLRGEPEPADDISMASTEHWNFVVTWPMVLPAEGPWRLGDGMAETLEEVIGYRFVSRRETTGEYEVRTGSESVRPQAPATRRFLLVASMVDHASYTGGTASTIVERQAPPTRLEAEDLVRPAMQAELRRTRGDAEYQPTITALASYELLD